MTVSPARERPRVSHECVLQHEVGLERAVIVSLA
jgi:hypothetical protein